MTTPLYCLWFLSLILTVTLVVLTPRILTLLLP